MRTDRLGPALLPSILLIPSGIRI
ncbi:hypothetical protein BGLA2_1710041 [Burkholderia gladioli]|nr:hypothetical protein BGLA2_1710041 [Burkholderia gladioli]